MKQGSVIARVFTSDALLPLDHVPVIFSQTAPDGSRILLALRETNSSGLTEAVLIDTPEEAASLKPSASTQPYATVTIQAGTPGYSSVTAEGVQIFPGIETTQAIQLRPVSNDTQSQTQTILETTQEL